MRKSYSRFRELWAVPRYKNLIKLGGWSIFFFFIFILSIFFSNEPLPNENSEHANLNSYKKMKDLLSESNLQIKYTIKSTDTYYLDGTLIDNIINATLETAETLTKIKIDHDKVYIVQKDREEISEILNEIELVYLFPRNIINIINDNDSMLKTSEDEKIYTYNIEGISYEVFTEENHIAQIKIVDKVISYELAYEIIN